MLGSKTPTAKRSNNPVARAAHATVFRIEPLEMRTLLAALTIAQENALPGTPKTTWDINGNGDTNIQGFATDMSTNVGGTVNFKVDDKTLANYHIDIYRLGYYQGNGARLITSIPAAQNTKTAQPAPLTNAATSLVDCGNWSVSAHWNVPADATSGVYVAKLVRDDTGGASQILFVVRNDTSHSDVLYQTSDTSWQAYNTYGGVSLYSFLSGSSRATKVSYNRPLILRGVYPQTNFFATEYPIVRFMESNGYDVSYFTDVDTDRNGGELLQHKIFMTGGHDEYWSGNQRTKVEAARDAGVNVAFLSGNDCYWKTRWETSIDPSGTPYRTLVCYKETWANAKVDPSSEWTGTWRDPRFSPPSDGGRPENALIGTLATVDDFNFPLTVSSAQGQLRLWRNTSLASIPAGSSVTFAQGAVGYEFNEDLDNGFRPAGLIDFSRGTFDVSPQKLLDFGSNVGNGTATHSLTMYRAPSGALVFSAGSIDFGTSLDAVHDTGGTTAPDSRVQQAVINLLADMRAQPATLQAGFAAAAGSTDVSAPTVSITSPPSGNIPADQPLTITGTATEVGGGQIAGIEVSTDGGVTWHPAAGTTTWTYTFSPNVYGAMVIKARAVDDSGNIGTPGPSANINIVAPSTISVWNDSVNPGFTPAQTANDGNPLEIGVKIRSDVAGQILGIRFYKTSANAGPHIGTLWSSTGTKLATAMFLNETLTGWQTVLFSAPVSISANTTYVASYFSSNGWYNVNVGYFSSAASNGPLHALADGTDGGNGVYRYGTTSAFPNSSFGGSNYWVDTIFSTTGDATPPTLSAQSPAPGATGVAASTTVTATFSEAVQSGTITFTLKDPANNPVAGTVTYNSATNTATFTPTSALASGTTYTATLSGAKDLAGNTMTTQIWSFTTADTVAPTVTARTPAAGATGVPVGSAATATFSEAIQSATIVFTLKDPANNPVAGAISYNATTLTATFTPTGTLAGTTTYTATVSGTKDVAGNTMTSTSWTFTTGSGADVTPPTVTSVTPIGGSGGVLVTVAPTATFSEAVQSATISMILKDAAGNSIAGAVSYNAATLTATFTPAAALLLNTTYTVTVSGTKDTAGNTMASMNWSFTTTGTAPNNIWAPSTTPGIVDSNDANALEIGVKFKTDVAGYIAGVRFYKAAANTGTHIGTLWNTSGVALATAVFTGESASGWQQVNFSTPVAISANTTYIVSYHSDTGHYSVNENYFTASVTNGHVTALQDGADLGNGVYVYGVSAFPTNTYHASNYWVDVAFTTGIADTTPPTITARNPASGATNVAVSSVITATFSEAVQSGTILFTLKDAANNPVPGTVSYNSGTNTATFTPTAALGSTTTYTATISGAQDLSGNAMASTNWSFTTADVTAPTIASRSPASGATGVSVGSTVTATFSEAVQSGTITFTLKDAANNPVAGTVSYNSATNTATFTPTSALNSAATYTAAVSGAQDLAGNTMTATSWSFTTASGPDITPPTITAQSPANGATNVAVSSVVTATFSEAVQSGTIVFTLKDAANNPVAGSVSYNSATNTATFTPTAALSGTTVYTATVSGTKDIAGNTMTATSWSFTTIDTAPPTVTTQTPAPGATNVAVASTVSATFNEAVQAGTIVFTLKDPANNPVAGTVAYNSATFTATFTPTAALSGSTTYTATLSGAKDTAGNTMATVTWSFTTADITPPTVTTRSPASGATGVPSNATVNATFSEAVQSGTIVFTLKDPANNPVAGTVAYNSATNTATFTPTSALAATTTYTATISGAKDIAGNTMASTSWSFTTAAGPDITPPTITAQSPASGATAVAISTVVTATFSEAVQPATIVFTLKDAANNPVAGTVAYNSGTNTATFTPTSALSGVTTYTASVSGAQDLAGNTMSSVTWSFTTADVTAPTVTARSPAPAATNVAVTSVVTATFSEAVQSGTIVFTLKDAANNPVAGSVSYNAATFTATFTPTAALASSMTYTAALSGAKDIAGNTMTAVSWSFTTADIVAPTVTAKTPAAGATGVATNTTLTATFSESIQPATLVFTLKDAANNPVTGTVTYNDTTKVATFTPSTVLGYSTSYTATVSGAKDLAGNTMATVTWSFTTVAAPATSYSLWTTETPATLNVFDGKPLEVGMKFKVTQPGTIKSIRFYKGTKNTGTHTASLWSSTGTLLGRVTVTGETASGWQTMNFASPITVAANTVYVISYFSPTGYYSQTGSYFTTGRDSGPVHALANSESVNGLYKYGSVPGFPNSTFKSTNYWVDVVFQPTDLTPPAVQNVTPAAGATGIAVNSTITITFNEAMDISTVNSSTIELRTAANVLVPSTVTYNAGTNTATITPTSALASQSTYTVIVKGGSTDPRAKDVAGNAVAANFTSSFTTVDTTPPTVTAQSPAPSATNVSPTATVSVTFNEDVQAGTIVFTLKDAANNSIAGSVSYSSGTRTATFTPTSALAETTTFTASVSGTKDIAGNTMSPVSWSFATADATAPTLASKSPASGATGVSITPTITATFSESIQPATLSFILKDAANNPVDGTVAYDVPTNTATFTPSSPLAEQAAYTVTVSSAKDLAGNTMSSASWSFTTADLTAPAVSGQSPDSGATVVAPTTTVTVTFTESIQPGTLSFVLKDSSDAPIAGAVSYNDAAKTATFTPSAALTELSTYTASVSAAQDLSGNTMSATSWSFTTADVTAPSVTARTPASASSVHTTIVCTATFSEAIQPGSLSFVVKDSFNNPVAGSVSYDTATRTATFTPAGLLSNNMTYTATVTATDTAGNAMTSAATWSFTTDNTLVWMQTLSSDFGAGTPSGTVVTANGGGAIELAPQLAEEFNGASLDPAVWTTSTWAIGTGPASSEVSGGQLALGQVQIKSNHTFTNTGIEGRIAFTAGKWQQFGLASDLASTTGEHSAVFTTKATTTTLFARVNDNGSIIDVLIGAIPSGFHVYSVTPVSGGYNFSIDGVVTNVPHAFSAGTALSAVISAQNGSPTMQADYIHVPAYQPSGQFVSSVFDAGGLANWSSVNWLADLPAGTGVSVEVSVGNTAAPDSSWSAWTSVTNGGSIGLSGRYVVYRVTLTTSNQFATSVLKNIALSYQLA